MKMNKTQAYIRASKFYLTDELPEDFENLTEDETIQFINENVWQPFEMWDPFDVLEMIDDLASEFICISSSKG